MRPVSSDPDSSNRQLCDRLTERITAHPQRRIPFAEFMAIALYDPDHGYYTTPSPAIGAAGDFYTSPHLGADFGELLAEQLAELWALLGYPQPLTLVEMGAGQGILAADLLRYLYRQHYDCFEAVEYVIVEISAAMRAEQQQRLKPLADSGQVRWCGWDDIAPNSITGCFFSNELVDALPVHQVAIAQGQLQEIYVTLAASPTSDGLGARFAEVLGELSTPALAEYFQLVGVDLPSDRYPDGYRTEVNLAALDWMQTVADRLHRGYVITIDYGYPAHRYYNPTRTTGTLQCYYQHAHHSDPYRHIGRQDLTAHVDFTALERQGEQCGLDTLGFVPQGLFLMALGLGDRLAALSYPEPGADVNLTELLQRRDRLQSLIDPMRLGNFGVLVQGRGVSSSALPRGLQIPTGLGAV
ncbi:MAG: SAM-dependent methyltransferase [Cyanobacteria bacterium J069]|nr:MAG: class I SAM-dependent methyltransferase [Cyanobacteria bacterium J069]